MFGMVFLAAALQFATNDASVAYGTAKDLVENCTPRNAGTIRGKIAANRILDAASMLGVDVSLDRFCAMTPHGERQFSNLYAEFSCDATSKWVVVMSHFDTKSGVDCPGANDGASTSGLLMGLANALCNWRTPHGNVMLVWTDGEECVNRYDENDGFHGSKRAVEYITGKGRKVRAVICLDMLGDRDLKISIPKNGSRTLAKLAKIAAKRIGDEGLVELSEDFVKDDHVAFLDAGMPAIVLIDFSYGPDNKWWHTSEDTMDKISERSLFRSGRLAVEILNIVL